MARLLPLLVLLLLALCVPATATAGAGKRQSVPAKFNKAHKLTKAKARKDLDRDGLSTWAEWRSKTNPRKADSDGDGRPDGREDRDRDGLGNAFELTARTDPAKPDTDGDRRRDGREDTDRDGLDHAAEAKYGYAPRKRDSDRDGVRDGDENAGVVRTVAGPLVTIALARGGTLVAALGDETEVACEPAVGDDAAGDALEPGEEITGDEELLDETGEEVTDEVDELADAAQADGEDDASEEGTDEDEADEPFGSSAEDDGAEGGDDACGAALRPGDLVRSARTTPGPAGLLLAELERLAP